MFAHTAVSSVPAPAFPGDLDPATRLPRRLGDWAKPRLQRTPGNVCQGPALPDNRGRQFLGRRRIARAGKVRWQSLTGTLAAALSNPRFFPVSLGGIQSPRNILNAPVNCRFQLNCRLSHFPAMAKTFTSCVVTLRLCNRLVGISLRTFTL